MVEVAADECPHSGSRGDELDSTGLIEVPAYVFPMVRNLDSRSGSGMTGPGGTPNLDWE
ncbi:MAG: hypothetical protein JSU85_16340 [Candidatus Zixiibacteriota bacterium]|nr:MAG: hypothetical protein JSU85_16340 [candidate division Zixibacteria bacterium]